MPKDHEVLQGDCIANIAFENGLLPDTVWDDPKNADLKELRKDPNSLLPGDVVHVPDVREQSFDVATGASHEFVRKAVPEKLQLQLLVDGEARANEDYELEIDGRSFPGTTDGEGRIEQSISPKARKAVLHFADDPDDRKLEIELGHIDPIEETTGVQGRLRSLGFYHGPIDGEESREFIQAIQEFQSESKLDPDGDLNDPTIDALRKAYGE